MPMVTQWSQAKRRYMVMFLFQYKYWSLSIPPAEHWGVSAPLGCAEVSAQPGAPHLLLQS